MNKGFTPSAFAKSSSIVTKSNDDQFKQIIITTNNTAKYIPQRSF